MTPANDSPPVPVPAGKLFAWRRAIASEDGPKSTTRLVLLTLSLHMNRSGGSCFPSTDTLAKETGLSERAVCTHLDLADKAGWISKHTAGVGGKGWARNGYTATLPANVAKALKEVQRQKKQGTEPDAQGTEPDDSKALKEVQSRTSVNSSVEGGSGFDSESEYRKAFPDVVLNYYQTDLLRSMKDEQAFRATLDYWLGNDYLGRSVYKFRDRYKQTLADTGADGKPALKHDLTGPVLSVDVPAICAAVDGLTPDDFFDYTNDWKGDAQKKVRATALDRVGYLTPQAA